MTMKNRKTLAAVAVVLLAFSLLFAAPAAAVNWNTVNGVNTTTVSDVNGLKAALADIESESTTAGDYVINLAAGNYELSDVLKITQKEGKDVTLQGAGIDSTTIKGGISVSGKSRLPADETLTIKSLTIDASSVDLTNGVIVFLAGEYDRYAHNVQIESVKIVGNRATDTSSTVSGINALTHGGVYGLTLTNVEISNCFAPVNGYIYNDVVINGCTFTDCSEGVNIQGSTPSNLEITGSTISADTYAVRLGSENTAIESGTIKIEGNVLEGESGTLATIIFRAGSFASDKEVTINDNIITGTILISDSTDSGNLQSSVNLDLSNNYWGGAEPTEEQLGGISFAAGTQYYTELTDDGTIDESSVATSIGSSVAKVGDTYYDDFKDALQALQSGGTLTLLSDVTITEDWDCRTSSYVGSGDDATFSNAVTIEGNEHTIKFTGKMIDPNRFEAFRFEAEASVKNLTIDMSQASSINPTRLRAISTSANLTVDNCIFIGNSSYTNTRGIIFGEGSTVDSNGKITDMVVSITSSIFRNWNYGVNDNENNKDVKSVTLNKNTFENAGVRVSAYDTVTFTNNVVEGGKVSIRSYSLSGEPTLVVTATGNTLDGSQINTISAASGIKSLNADEDFAISLKAQIDDVYYSTLEAAVDAAESGDTITLLGDVEVNSVITISESEITIVGNGKNITSSSAFTANSECVLIVTGDNFNMTGVTIDDSAREKSGVAAISVVILKGKNAELTDNVIKAGKSVGHRNTGIVVYATAENTILKDNVIYLGESGRTDNAEKQRNESIGIRTYPTDGNNVAVKGLQITGNTINKHADVTNPQVGILIDGAQESDSMTVTDNIFDLGVNGVVIEVMAEKESPSLALTFKGNDVKSAKTFLSLVEDNWAMSGFALTLSGEFSNDLIGASFISVADEETLNVPTGIITGGTFSSNPSAYIAPGMEVVQPGDKYLVQKYVDRSGTTTKPVEPETPVDPETPEEPEQPVDTETPVDPETPGEDLPTIPDVEPTEPVSPAPILAVLAGLGAAVVLRRK